MFPQHAHGLALGNRVVVALRNRVVVSSSVGSSCCWWCACRMPQVYRGTWNHTDIAAKQYLPHLPHLPSSSDGQEDNMQGQTARAVAVAQVRPLLQRNRQSIIYMICTHAMPGDIDLSEVLSCPGPDQTGCMACCIHIHMDNQLHSTTYVLPAAHTKWVHDMNAMEQALQCGLRHVLCFVVFRLLSPGRCTY